MYSVNSPKDKIMQYICNANVTLILKKKKNNNKYYFKNSAFSYYFRKKIQKKNEPKLTKRQKQYFSRFVIFMIIDFHGKEIPV